MKIGYDGKRAAQNFTGLGNYSRYVLEALAGSFPGEEYLVYVPKDDENKKFDSILSAAAGAIRKVLPTGHWDKKFRSLWRVWGITDDIARDGVQVFHGLSNELPLNIRRISGNVKSVVTVHDLIFLKCPECYPFIDRNIYNYKFRRACVNADRVIAVSECTKRDIVKHYGIAPEKIDVIYQGCDSLFAMQASEEDKAAMRKKYSLPAKFVVSVGTIERRKNLLSVVKALSSLPEDVHLVAVGRRTKYTALIDEYVQKNNLQNRVHLLHGVPYADLPVIYQCADVFAYMSIYEGFGIPLLEALNCRVPVVAATGSCLEEAGGPGSKYTAPYDVEAIASAIKECFVPEVRETMIAQGLEWAAKFTPENFAQQTMNCYRKLLSEE
jgi:glycosyltransferase involved in cell wall biosynthesis